MRYQLQVVQRDHPSQRHFRLHPGRHCPLNAAQDAHQNPIESNPTIEAKTLMTKNDSEAVRVARVRQLWNARPYAERTGTQVLMFYGWLEKHYPDLLKHGKGDPYQHLKVDLRGLWKD